MSTSTRRRPLGQLTNHTEDGGAKKKRKCSDGKLSKGLTPSDENKKAKAQRTTKDAAKSGSRTILSAKRSKNVGGKLVANSKGGKTKNFMQDLHMKDLVFYIFTFLGPIDLMASVATCSSWKELIYGSDHLRSVRRAYEKWQMYRVLVVRQRAFKVSPYILKQPSITENMRKVLADWLYQVNSEFENRLETLFLAMCLVDRFFDAHTVSRTEIQLAGVVGLLIASKAEENRYPDIGELLYLCDGIYERPQLLKMETLVLNKLNHTLHVPTVITFLKFLQLETKQKPAEAVLCDYMADQTLLSYDNAMFTPSITATAILCVAAIYFDRCFQNVLLISGHKPAEIISVLPVLLASSESMRTGPTRSVKEKYTGEEKFGVIDINLGPLEKYAAKFDTKLGPLEKDALDVKLHPLPASASPLPASGSPPMTSTCFQTQSQTPSSTTATTATTATIATTTTTTATTAISATTISTSTSTSTTTSTTSSVRLRDLR